MRSVFLVFSLVLAAVPAIPAQASNSIRGFATMERCERYLERWRDRLDKGRSGGWSDVEVIWDAAYCEERDGRFFVVLPG